MIQLFASCLATNFTTYNCYNWSRSIFPSVIITQHYKSQTIPLQCFDTVGWVRERSSGLQKNLASGILRGYLKVENWNNLQKNMPVETKAERERSKCYSPSRHDLLQKLFQICDIQQNTKSLCMIFQSANISVYQLSLQLHACEYRASHFSKQMSSSIENVTTKTLTNLYLIINKTFI